MTVEYVLTYDLGTSAVKAALFDTEGKLAASESMPCTLYTPEPGWAEQEPEEYWRGVCLSGKKAIQSAGIRKEEILGIAFSTQWKAVIPVDKDGNVLHRAIIWLDSRAKKEAEELTESFGHGGMSDSEYWPRVLWVKKHLPEIYDRSTMLLGVDSYLKWKATGTATTDETQSFAFSRDKALQDFYDGVFAAGALDPRKFPPITAASEEAGRVTEKVAEELGLCPGTKVFGGSADLPAIAVGAGSSGYGREHIYLGSSGWFGQMTDISMKGNYRNMVVTDGSFLRLKGMQSVCMTQNWAVQTFYQSEFRELGDRIYQEVVQPETAIISPGADGLLAAPWLFGERAPLGREVQAAFLNLRPLHSRAHLIAALWESIACNMKMCQEIVEDGSREEGPVRIVGGGARCAQWMQIFADVLGRRVEVPADPQYAGTRGCAMMALTGLGRMERLTDADREISAAETFEPRAEYQDLYARLYEAFLKIYPSVREISRILNAEK